MTTRHSVGGGVMETPSVEIVKLGSADWLSARKGGGELMLKNDSHYEGRSARSCASFEWAEGELG